MKRSMKVGIVLILVVASSAFGWWIGYREKEAELEALAMFQHVFHAGQSVSVLQMLDEDREDTARLILTNNAESSLRWATEGLAEVDRVPSIALPNLLESMRRAKQYYEDTDQPVNANLAGRIIQAWENALKEG